MAFHPYPQLIRAVFNPQRFGPPPGVTPASPWPWIDRVGFGSTPTYSVARFGLAFASAPAHKALTSHVRSNSPDHNAKGTQSPVPKDRLLPLVCTRFQDLFHSPLGVLFTFPSRYYSLSVTGSYLALEDGPPRFDRGFTCPGLLGYSNSSATSISHTGLSPSTVCRSRHVPLCFRSAHAGAPQPRRSLTLSGLG